MLSAPAVHPCGPPVLASLPGLPAAAFAIVAKVVKVGEVHSEAHGDVAAARASAWPSVGVTVAEGRSEAGNLAVRTTAFALACASACDAAAAGERTGGSGACCWAHFVGCR